MIICHCQAITDTDIHRAIDWMRGSDSGVLITPGRVYRALGKAADCGGCVPLFLQTMQKNPNLTLAQIGADPEPQAERVGDVPAELRGLRRAP